MNPATHFLAGWLIANMDHLERRDRALVTLAGVVPDADGLGILADVASRDQGGAVFYGQYHHILAHNLFFGLFLTAAAYALAKKKGLAALLVLFSFHVHLLGDLLSGRGPDGTVWTVSYLYPFLTNLQLFWFGQWELNAGPNVAVTAAFLVATFYLAWRRGFSPMSIFSVAADRAVVATLRNRFPIRQG